MNKIIKENCEKEEWGGWKIVSDMLDHPDKNGIYPTSKCYQKLYEFVVAQKEKALQADQEDHEKLIIALVDKKDRNCKRYLKEERADILKKIEKYKAKQGAIIIPREEWKKIKILK